MEIMKASAGSGKTFNLARKYITLLFKKKDRNAYRHILAVTFTNKATDEMKSRIMKELFILATDPASSGYLRYFIPSMFTAKELEGIAPEDFIGELPGKPGEKITLESLSDSAKDMLCAILHDYGAFSVSTIDRFFQQTLKAFSREIGQFSSYQVELDKDSLVTESVDRVLDSVNESDPDLLKWLVDSVMDQMELGGRYRLEKDLAEIGARLMSDEHRSLAEKLGTDVGKDFSKERLTAVRRACLRTVKEFERDAAQKASAVLALLPGAGLTAEDFNRKFLVALYSYAAGQKKDDVVDAPSDFFMRVSADPEQWFAKTKKNRFLPMAYPLIEAPLADFCALFGERYSLYRTALMLMKCLCGLGVAADIHREFVALMKEKNVLSIDDSNTILRDIIDGSDAPFIYEKTGVRYENFLLDEFQDTSRIQWDNFLPLLRNSESQGFDSLIVGDVKQSIYRWRGSDWNLLDSEVEGEFPGAKVRTLGVNYRSCRRIVSFNNAFFPEAARLLDDIYGETEDRSIAGIYSDVGQTLPEKVKGEGEVRLTFCAEQDETAATLEAVRALRERGVPYREITVLVRSNAIGANVASFLIDNDVPVVTDDSLKVRSSVTVNRLCSLLARCDNPSDAVSAYVIRDLGIEVPQSFRSLVDLCETLLRELHTADPELFDAEVLYVQSFMDAVQDYMNVEGNNLHGFLKYWEDADPAISSPSEGDSVRVMTVHKSKGLDFEHVIFPCLEGVVLFKPGNRWCCPDLSGTPLEEASGTPYDVFLSSKCSRTAFSDDYRRELRMQYVDNLNIMYVAMTRAVKSMWLIGELPSDDFRKCVDSGGKPKLSDFSQLLYQYSVVNQESLGLVRVPGAEGTLNWLYSAGEVSGATEHPETCGLKAAYPSWPLNGISGSGSQVDVRERGRLKFRADSLDFFGEEGFVKTGPAGRLKGIVLHDVLSKVETPSDLRRAVDDSVAAGEMTTGEGEEAFSLLSERIASAGERGWFPEETVSEGQGVYCTAIRREVTLIDVDGSLSRPDRVLEFSDGSVLVIDYKFGKRVPPLEKRYLRQISGYADIYRRMGRKEVRTALWYVTSDEIVDGPKA